MKLAEAFVATLFSSTLPPAHSSLPLNPTDIDSKSFQVYFLEIETETETETEIEIDRDRDDRDSRIHFPEIWTHW